MPITGLPPLRKPFWVLTVTSNSVVCSSAAEITYSNVASYNGLTLSLMTIVFRLDSFERPGRRYSFTYGSGMLDGSFRGMFLYGSEEIGKSLNKESRLKALNLNL